MKPSAFASLWLLPNLALAQSVVTADASPQSAFPTGFDQFVLTLSGAGGAPGMPSIALANLTLKAVNGVGLTDIIHGSPLIVDSNTTSKLTSNNIALIQCDESAYPGFRKPGDLLQEAASKNLPAIVLFSNTTNFCHLDSADADLARSLIYTMTTPDAWEALKSPMQFSQNGGSWIIARRNTVQNSNNTGANLGGSSTGGYNPGGPSPSTAVAMIILYSITGVITALFLIIIITGAIRAHRHPERYGPRNVLGRPRQSRARGLARAMLDTLPIHKFGEQDEAVKPADGDVELAQGSANAAHETRKEEIDCGAEPTSPVASGSEPRRNKEEEATLEGVEVADSQQITAAGATATQKPHDPTAHAADEDNSLGCSICTEDFEKGQDVRVLPCNHSFHPACIDPWLLNVSGTCPLCRIDLRPNAAANSGLSNTLSTSTPGGLPPPLEGGESGSNHRASRRLSGFLDILNPRRMEEATSQERLAALRRLHEQREATVNPGEELESRRMRRLTARLGDTFGIRTRARETSPTPSLEGSNPAAVVAAPATNARVATIVESSNTGEASGPTESSR